MKNYWRYNGITLRNRSQGRLLLFHNRPGNIHSSEIVLCYTHANVIHHYDIAQTITKGGDILKKNSKFEKAVEIICILLEVAFAFISLPFKIIKAIFDIADIIKKNPA